MSDVRFAIDAIEFLERPVRFRLPFRFGGATLTEAPQVFARVWLHHPGTSTSAAGASAEMMMPKWFDKNPALTNADNIAQLRRSLALARDAYLSDKTATTAFAHHARHYRALMAAGAAAGLNPLTASYGPALIDRAIIDAVCRALGVSFFELFRANGAGFDPAALLPEFDGFDARKFLTALRPLDSLDARHTVGLADPIDAGEPADAATADGLPRTLVQIIAAYGHRYFKIKVGGDITADLARLRRIAAVLDTLPEYHATLDGNEQFDDLASFAEWWREISADATLARLRTRTLFVEQPIARGLALSLPVPAADIAFVIDEADGDLDALPAAWAQGYRGVSSKSCKGLYKSLINLARVARWNGEAGSNRYFMTAEDLTMQAGLAVQQDLALVAMLGISHVERNGHHFVDGMANLPAREQQAFLSAHRDLYTHAHGATRLRIERGKLAIGSLSCVGFASAAEPEWNAMAQVPVPRPAADTHASGSSAPPASAAPTTTTH